MAISKPKKQDKVFVVLRYFLHKSKQDKRKDFTNKKAQKLLFYAQAWSLVLRNERLFDEEFQAWVHGAAIPKVYQQYSDFGFNPIDEDVDSSEFSDLTKEEIELLDDVWRVYGKYDADYLELLNHQEKPWQKARAGMPEGMASCAIIKENDMKEYYGEKIQELQKEKKIKFPYST